MPVQGKRLDGSPFEVLGLTDRIDSADAYEFHVPFHSRALQERQAPRDFDQLWHDDRTVRGAFAKERDAEVFMSRWLLFEDDQKDDEEWGPIRLLGKGGYGMVGLWQKRNDKNQIIDEVVCKETEYLENKTRVDEIEVDPRAYPRILTEAAIHSDINARHPGVSPHLRKYKFISHATRGQKGRYRFYLEYCPYGNLHHLGRLYRCWNTYLPEVFIWHVFYSLAKACEALRNTPPLNSKAIKEEYFENLVHDELFCLHLDWKPENILLGYPHEGEEYPSALLNDYGISMYTTSKEGQRQLNPGLIWWRGTHTHKTPEQIHFGVNWEIPPDGGWIRSQDDQNRELPWKRAAALREVENTQPNADVLFDHSMNIYGVGHTMFDIVTLAASAKHLGRIRAKSLKRFQQNGNHQISSVYTKKPGVYSSRLRHLIHRCLDPDPANRPTQLELMDETRRGLRLAIKRAKRDRKFPAKVCFRADEINDMPLGDAGFQPLRKELKNLIESQFVDPDAPKLKLPAQKYGVFPDAWFNPSWKAMYSQRNPHDRWFNGLHGNGNASSLSSHEANVDSDSDHDDDDDGDTGDNGNGGRRATQDARSNAPSPEVPNSQNQTPLLPPPEQQPQQSTNRPQTPQTSILRSDGRNVAGQYVAPKSPPGKRVRFALRNGNLDEARSTGEEDGNV
ncbi:uncharacterized protein Z519_06360 [Cladophialophora bantiana CBS 173.52]|uniref:non-specific serine/threonine protein kinase n=1 Tax=Cladophialophora bantiana (strain ATCC 10958 / CBS 173.52 / CDC B-1940 / NIH 8579) TaxID=1442370 RepID=A0A0D2HGZ1_CLAB1|nr:uncharacterized protein Z519_06360 [Cladophialophora bantiana CBS 173.52]KIW92513.1 hypothetical protein Z519_06360 [Cladophialophora bantiana CBS 173.52]